MMPLQNNVLPRGRPHPEGATAGPPPDATPATHPVVQLPLDTVARLRRSHPRRAIWAQYHFLLEELALGPFWLDVKFYYGQVHEDGPGTSDSEEETGSETGY